MSIARDEGHRSVLPVEVGIATPEPASTARTTAAAERLPAWAQAVGLDVGAAAAVVVGLYLAGHHPALAWAWPVLWAGFAVVLAGAGDRLLAVRPVVRALALTWAGAGVLTLLPDPGAGSLLPAVVVAAGVSAAGSAAGRGGLRLLHRGSDQAHQDAVVVGDRAAITQVARDWIRFRSGIRPVAACVVDLDADVHDMPLAIEGVPVLGGPRDAGSTADLVDADLVAVLPGAAMTTDALRRITWSLAESPARLALLTPLLDASLRRVAPRLVGDRLLLDVRPPRQGRVINAVKSALDRAVAAALLLLAAPLLVTLVVLIRRDSAGPGLFRQTRVGVGGSPFTLLKLRSMYVGAELEQRALAAQNESDGALFKIRKDPRITRVGRFLRRTSLDELPQLINVLRGEMSLVGPRPALPDEVASYGEWARRRLVVKPGLTGLWQVSGRSDLSWSESLRLDLRYADNWSVLGDLSLLAQTVPAVTRGKGAY